MTIQQKVINYFHPNHLINISKLERLAGIGKNRLNYYINQNGKLTDDEAVKVLKALRENLKAVV